MRLSIALCTHNGADYLLAQLTSYLKQSYWPYEVVVCDDCSTDQTLALLSEFAILAPFQFHVFQNEQRLGYSKNFEKAIGLCTGDIILYSDQDDVWMPDKLERIDQVFSQNPRIGLVFSNAAYVDQELNPLGKTLWQVIHLNKRAQKLIAAGRGTEVVVRNNSILGMVLAFRADLRSVLLPFPDTETHDLWTVLMLSLVSEIALIPEILVMYRRHANTATSTGNNSIVNFKAITSTEYAPRRKQQLFRRIASYQAACERLSLLDDLPVVDKERNSQLLRGAIDHHSRRSQMPSRRLLRIPGIFREYATLSYHRYSHPVRAAIRDLFQR